MDQVEGMEQLYAKYPSLKKYEEVGEEDYVESHDGREEKLLETIKARPDYASLQGNPTAVLQAIDHFSTHDDFLINIGPDKAGKTADIIAEEKPKVFVELGGYMGYSAIWFADAMRKAAQPGEKLLYLSLELEERFARIAEELVKIAGLDDFVKFVTGPASDSLKKLASDGTLPKQSVDLFFLDHVEDLYTQELKVAEELGILKKGGLVVADNVLRPGAPEYRKYVRDNPAYETKAVPGLIVPGDWTDEIDVSRVK